MSALFVFLFKVNAALILFYLGYFFILRNLTFYNLNRVYLVCALIFSSIYPFINLSAFVQRHAQISAPVKAIVLNWRQPVINIVKPIAQPDYWSWAAWVFWAGVAVLTMRLLIQLISLFKLNRMARPARLHNYPVKIIQGDAGPFSFWRSIYINPDKHEPQDLQAILQHEQVHIEQWHVLDILLAEVSTIFYWFNPGVWLMRKAIRENIEFITDLKIVQQGANMRAYQYSLLSVGLAATSNSIVNHFNLSTIKKRIIMMNAKRSSAINFTRYTFILPLVLVLLLFTISMTDFARPITIRLMTAVKPVIKEVKSSLNAAPVVTNTNHATIKSPAVAPKKRDTLNLTLTKAGQSNADSMIFFINGKKGDLSKVNPGDIEHMYIIKGSDASSYINESLDDQTKAVIIITKNNEEGRVLYEKLKRVYSENNNYVGARRLSLVYADSALQKVHITGRLSFKQGDSIHFKPLVTKAIMVKPKQLNEVVVEGFKYDTLKKGVKLNAIRIAVNDSVYTRLNTTSVQVNGQLRKNIDMGVVYALSVKEPTYKLSDKLIIIDGEEATEKKFKKLSAADIESISFKSDADMKRKYGDKAQNGVVFIVTKK